MQCPHCSVAFRERWQQARMKYDDRAYSDWHCISTVCPECHNPSIKIKLIPSETGVLLMDLARPFLVKEQWVYPNSRRGTSFGDEVPDNLRTDYREACEVLLVSPRSSATLSRRIVEIILGEQGYTQNRLVDRVKAVRKEADSDKKLPAVLLRTIDAVWEFGNFSAHQKTNLKTLQIIDVEPGEAELCLEIVEGLFEHYYVRPAIDEEKLKNLNEKMEELGREPL